MAKASTVLPDRTNVRKIPDGSGAIVRVDGIEVGRLVYSPVAGYSWEEQPRKHFAKRRDATDFMLLRLIEAGRIDPKAATRDLRAEAVISPSVKHQVFERDNGLCQYCLVQGNTVPGTEYDHFIPAGAGGDGSVNNVQLACAECNRRKWHRHPEELWGNEWSEWGPLRDRSNRIARAWRN